MFALTAVEYAQCSADDALVLMDVPLEKLGNPPHVGFLFCLDKDGKHWTVATGDQDVVQEIEAAQKLGNNTALAGQLGLALDESRFPVMRGGWPEEWPLSTQPTGQRDRGPTARRDRRRRHASSLAT
jgi:hypothetical protein